MADHGLGKRIEPMLRRGDSADRLQEGPNDLTRVRNSLMAKWHASVAIGEASLKKGPGTGQSKKGKLELVSSGAWGNFGRPPFDTWKNEKGTHG